MNFWFDKCDIRHSFDAELRDGAPRVSVLFHSVQTGIWNITCSREDTRRRVRPKESKDLSREVMRENATRNETRRYTCAYLVCVRCARRQVRGFENIRSRCTIARCVRNIKSRFYGYCPMPWTFFFFLFPCLLAGDATAGVRVSHGSGTLHSRNY